MNSAGAPNSVRQYNSFLKNVSFNCILNNHPATEEAGFNIENK